MQLNTEEMARNLYESELDYSDEFGGMLANPIPWEELPEKDRNFRIAALEAALIGVIPNMKPTELTAAEVGAITIYGLCFSNNKGTVQVDLILEGGKRVHLISRASGTNIDEQFVLLAPHDIANSAIREGIMKWSRSKKQLLKVE